MDAMGAEQKSICDASAKGHPLSATVPGALLPARTLPPTVPHAAHISPHPTWNHDHLTASLFPLPCCLPYQ